MKTPSKIFRNTIALFSCLAVTSAFSQSTYVWTNQNPQQLELSPVPGQGAGDLNQGTNWTRIVGPSSGGTDANGVPRPDFQDGVIWGDEMQFNGLTTGPVIATQDGGAQANGAGSGQPYGLHIHLTANQTSPVTLYTRAGGASGGMRMNSIQIDAGAGRFSLGSNSLTGVLDIVGGVLNGQIFTFTNNSTTPAVINPDTRYRMGGAGAHPFIFSGSGDWIVNNHMRSANSSAIIVQKFGPGTMTWTGTNVDTGTPGANWGDQLGTPITIGEGTMIWKTSDLVSSGTSGNPNIVNNATWKYDVQPVAGLVTGPGQVLGTISGAGSFEMHAGTVTFRGANTFAGPINLTGGELIAGSTENVGTSGPLGQGGTISFNGGTLGWSLANAFDYSSRFDTSPNQTYNLDTGGSSPTFATGLSSSGGSLNKLGGGTLTLSGANTYTGPTTIAAGGGLIFQGTKSGNADITVSDTATLGVFENGSQITPNTLTLGTSTGATLEFNNVTNHTLATLAPNNLVSAGPVTINVNSGRFTLIGETFALLKWTSGPAPATSLGFLAGAGGHLSTNGNEIDVVIDNPPYIWTGAINAAWDTTTIDWVRNALPATWVNGNFALLDDSSTVTNLTMSGIITPTNIAINNSSSPYAITNSPGNVIGGGGSLTKTGNGSLILPGGANTYTGPTTLGGGLVAVDVLANGGSPSDIGAASSAAGNIVFSGGTLQYTGPGVSVDRLFTVGPGGGTIDNESAVGGQLAFTSTGSIGMSGNGPRALILTGPGFGGGDTLACNLTNHPAGTSLTKSGPGLWILTGTNTYAGGTTLLQGSLQIGAGAVGTGGPSGAIGNGTISTDAGTSIDFLRSGTLTVPGAINGAASVTLDGSGTVILANNNGYTGGTTINSGTLQVGSGGGSGSLYVNGPIINNSLLVFNTAGSFVYQAAGLISGSGNVIFQGGGTIKAIGANSYTGWTRIDSGTTFFCREGQDGLLASSVVTNNGTLRIVSQDTAFVYPGAIWGSGRVQIGANNVNVGTMTLSGSNSYTGGTFIGDNQLILGDGITPGSGAILGNVQFVNNFTIAQDNPRTLTFNRPDNYTFPGTITTNFASPQGNLGIVQQNGTGTLTLTANNTYGGGTVVNGGFLVIGNGGASGSVGFGPVTLNSGNPLVINRSGNLTIWGNISGISDVLLKGGATVTLNGVNNSYSGATTVSNGTLIVSGTNATSSTHVYVGGLGNGGTFISGPVTLEAGTTLVPNGSVGPQTIMSDFTNDASAMVFEINKLASPANDSINVTGTLARNVTGGTLTVKNLGPNTLVPGDTFTLFSQPLPNGASITVTGARATWVNNLAVNGSVSVATVSTIRPNLNYTNTGTSLQFSWSDPFNSFKLQAQTNSINVGISTNWADYPGGTANPITVPIVKTNATVFYRIVSIP